MLLEKEKSFLEVNSQLYKDIYQHVTFLANFRFKSAIEYLRTAHHGYEVEDFIQETMRLLTDSLDKKKFPSMRHLKKFISKTMEFHYLYEKKKYFQTKQRSGSQNEDSLDRMIDEHRDILDTVFDKKSLLFDNLQLKQILQENLYVIYNNGKVSICKDIFNLRKDDKIFSVNFLLKLQYEKDTKDKVCRHYKDNGIWFTKNMLDEVNSLLYDYYKEKELI